MADSRTPAVAQLTHAQKRAIQLRLLNEISTRLQSLLDADDFAGAVVSVVQSRFHYYSLQLWNVAPDGASYGLVAIEGAYREHIQLGQSLKTAEGVIGAAVRSKKSYLTNDVRNDPHFHDLGLPILTRSELAVPVLDSHGRVLAVINVESDGEAAFDEEDVITLEAVAAQVSVAFSNRRLYGEAKSFSQKLQRAVEEKTQELRQAHERILEQQRLLQKENKALKTLVNHDNKTMDIVGKSPAVNSVLAMVDKIAPTTATVLIQGESGTGKELIARRLHFNGDRADRPYVTVNCGALQESLLESELFGHEKGSFTGAIVQKIGLCETADGGTLFLDEIGEMSMQIQAKLLRFLQEGEFYRIGGKRPIKVNVRVISATNRELEREVAESRFREDLFYRLNTITLRMPPLRKRKEDIPALLEFFLKHSRFGGTSHQIRKIDPRVLDAFQNYDWPGNIRELQNTIERLKILAENQEIRLDDIPFNIRMPKARGDSPAEFAIELSLEELEKKHILRSLAFHQGNKTRTAQALGITIKTLYNKLHRYGVIPPTGSAAAAASALQQASEGAQESVATA